MASEWEKGSRLLGAEVHLLLLGPGHHDERRALPVPAHRLVERVPLRASARQPPAPRQRARIAHWPVYATHVSQAWEGTAEAWEGARHLALRAVRPDPAHEPRQRLLLAALALAVRRELRGDLDVQAAARVEVHRPYARPSPQPRHSPGYENREAAAGGAR
jgi:hypothetical protein